MQQFFSSILCPMDTIQKVVEKNNEVSSVAKSILASDQVTVRFSEPQRNPSRMC